MISEFLAPFEKNIVDFKESLPDRSIGKKITLYSKSITDLTNIDIALIGLNEYRGSVETNSNYLKINYLRKEFYSLYLGDWNINLIDLGDIINGDKLFDTYYAVQIICEELVNNNVIPFFIGSSQDLTYPIYKSYCNKNKEINLTSIDNKFDFGEIKKEFNDSSFMSKILMDDNNELNHYSNIGFQTFLNSQEEIDLLEKLQFETYRLGKVNREMEVIEPCLRSSNIVSIDFKSVKASELNFVHNYPNGFLSNQICNISRYAGLSNNVSSIGVFDVYDNKICYSLLSQVIWYFIEGFSLRIDEDPYSKDFNGNSYHVVIENENFKFFESELSQKWWFELKFNGNNSLRSSLIPCSNQDYIDACNQKISKRILQSLKRNFV